MNNDCIIASDVDLLSCIKKEKYRFNISNFVGGWTTWGVGDII